MREEETVARLSAILSAMTKADARLAESHRRAYASLYWAFGFAVVLAFLIGLSVGVNTRGAG
jgi:hypothetical protein